MLLSVQGLGSWVRHGKTRRSDLLEGVASPEINYSFGWNLTSGWGRDTGIHPPPPRRAQRSVRSWDRKDDPLEIGRVRPRRFFVHLAVGHFEPREGLRTGRILSWVSVFSPLICSHSQVHKSEGFES